jgi:CDP-diacylglycerol---serine O-phosphatidyltransferase
LLNQIVKAVPNLFTIGNLLCGVLSITCNMSGFLEVASILISLAFILFPTMGALRLARFSVKPTIGYFKGLPIPAAGLPVAGMGFFYIAMHGLP